MVKKLTLQQDNFCIEYVKNGYKGAEAARQAKYSVKNAHRIATRLLSKVHIQDRIKALKEKIDEESIMTATEILKELSIIARSDIQNYVTIDDITGAIQAKGFKDMPEGASRALESISEDRVIKESADGKQVTVYDKIKFKCHSKIQALDKLGQYRDLWKDKGDSPTTIIINAEPHPKVING